MATLEEFISKFEDFSAWDPRKQIEYIVYFLSIVRGKASVTTKDVQEAFISLDLKPYPSTAQYLSKEVSNTKTGKFIKVKPSGYRLERRKSDEITSVVNSEPIKIEVSSQLADLVPKLKNSTEKAFLVEAIHCYRVESFRATIILIWILSIDHLQNYIFGNKLVEFNLALAKNPDKKISKIVQYDDFSEIKDTKLIELARSSNIISNDVRKILDEKLGIRNSAAHPSNIVFSSHKAAEFILDLISNVVLKY